MMPEFELLTPQTAPERARENLEKFEKKFRFIPNMQRAMSLSPETLDCYLASFDEFEKTSFTPAEKQVVLIATSIENNCTYCVAGHTGLARMAKMSPEDLEALRAGTTMPDPKLNALRNFTRQMVLSRGQMNDADVEAFLAAGFNKQNLIEVVLGVAHKTISNYVNQLVRTPLDTAFAQDKWERTTGPTS